MSSKVVVTGVGVLGGWGGLEETWAGLERGARALGELELEEAGIRTLGVRAPEASVLHLPDRKLQKYMSPAARMAVIAAGRALSDAGLLDDEERLAHFALHLATSLIAFDLGAVRAAMLASRGDDGRLDLRRMGGEGFRLCNPLLPFKMLLNTPLGLASIIYRIRGDNFILYPGASQGAACLEAALRGLERGRYQGALVGGVSHALSLLPVATARRLGRSAARPEAALPFAPGHQGLGPSDAAVFLVLETEAAALRRGRRPRARLASVATARSTEEASDRRAARRRLLAAQAAAEPPAAVLSTGNLDAQDDADEIDALRARWPERTPALDSADGSLGFAGPAALPLAIALAVRALEAGELPSLATGAGVSLEAGASLCASLLDPDGGCATARIEPVRGEPTRVPSAALTPRRRVVVTGLGVVSPIGSGILAFFDGLRSARSGVDTIRSFDASGFATRIAGEVKGLDLARLALPEAERPALLRDPKACFGLCAAREALAQAFGSRGARASYPPERIGAFIAAGLEIFNLEDLIARVLPLDAKARAIVDGAALLEETMAAPPHAHLQIPADLGARCIAGEAGAGGPYAVNLSACAAGTQAVGEALRAIREGACEAAIAGGYDSMVNPLGVGGFCLLEALSRANELRGRASRPFDARRDGFVLGEGAGMLVLEEREAALRRGASILCELLGYASTLDAYRMTDPAPDAAGAVAAIRGALADAGIAPEAVDYVNAHGTGTRKNDPAETAALHQVFGAHAERLPVSSTKSQIGHLIGAAGAVELLATIFALREGILPATINLEESDPECDLDYVPRAPRPTRIRVALKSSFGFGGQNASLVVARPSEEQP